MALRPPGFTAAPSKFGVKVVAVLLNTAISVEVGAVSPAQLKPFDQTLLTSPSHTMGAPNAAPREPANKNVAMTKPIRRLCINQHSL